MPSQPAIPALLSPLLQTPPRACSLYLLTSVLSASTNWLVLRFIYAALLAGEGEEKKHLNNNKNNSSNNNNNRNYDGTTTTTTTGELRVLMISWLRGLELWREMGRRLGIDFSRAVGVGGGGKLTFLDGLESAANFGAGGAKVREVEREILNAVQRLKQSDKSPGQQRRVLVILDGVDFLAAAIGAEATELMDMITEIREHTHAIIVTASADAPLMQVQVTSRNTNTNTDTSTPLEVNHSALVMSLVHQASVVCAVRALETGVARDISGILRVGRGGGAGVGAGDGGDGDGSWEEVEVVEEMEVLYFVEADGGVRVFERGK